MAITVHIKKDSDGNVRLDTGDAQVIVDKAYFWDLAQLLLTPDDIGYNFAPLLDQDA